MVEKVENTRDENVTKLTEPSVDAFISETKNHEFSFVKHLFLKNISLNTEIKPFIRPKNAGATRNNQLRKDQQKTNNFLCY